MAAAKTKQDDYEIKLDVVVNESEAVALAKKKVEKSYAESDLVLLNQSNRKPENGGGYICTFGVKTSLVKAEAKAVTK